jgi:RimJ/RimL family protein N-acetyltransferase
MQLVDLQFRRFQQEDYAEYAAWFVDPELNRRLGPMDQEWLDATLTQMEEKGVTWAVFREQELVAVIETAFDPTEPGLAAITALAIKPNLRRQGIGTAVLQQLLEMHRRRGIHEHWTHLKMDNEAARRCIEQAGFKPISGLPDAHGYVEFRLEE